MASEKQLISVNSPQNPCRAYAILAREASQAVILRRGPSDWVQLIRWETASDVLLYGQWFKGRIYERRCDLSPDGSLFIYFARKKNRRTIKDNQYTYAWTAVSKPPYFTALALWPKGNCWNGGGLFEDNKTIRLNHNPERLAAHPDHQPTGLKIILDFEEKGEDFSIFPKLLCHHGWGLIQDGGSWNEVQPLVWKPKRPDIWRKHGARQGLSLNMYIFGNVFNQFGDSLLLRFEALDEQTGKTYPIENATWADWDQQGRLVYIARGCLLQRQFQSKEKLARVIADLNPQIPTRLIAPDWAKSF